MHQSRIITPAFLIDHFAVVNDSGIVILSASYSKHLSRRIGEPIGFPAKDGYIRARILGRLYPLHHIVWAISTGKLPVGDIDHINGIRDDNRICNLREVSRKTNSQNQHKATLQNRTSGMLGVSFDKERRKWSAFIEAEGKSKRLGRFNTPEEAHVAYLNAKRRLHAGCAI